MIWGWGAPWFFVFLGSLIPLLFIYLFRRKARPFFTAALFLWGSAGEEGGAAPRFRLMKLPVNFFLHAGALLLLVCAGAALFTFRQDRFPPAAVILNNSYAMTPEVRKKAAEMLRHHLSRFPGRRVVYFRAGTLPERLDLRGAAADLSSFWKADEPEFRAGRAIAAAGMHVPGGEIIVITDRPLPEKPPHVTCLCAGTPGPNAAIVNARYSDGRILLEVENFSLIPLEPELTAGNFARRRFTLGPKERKVFRLTVPVLAGPCRVLLKTPGDKLPFDDAALLLPERREPVRFACRSLPPAADRAVKQVLEGNPEIGRAHV